LASTVAGDSFGSMRWALLALLLAACQAEVEGLDRRDRKMTCNVSVGEHALADADPRYGILLVDAYDVFVDRRSAETGFMTTQRIDARTHAESPFREERETLLLDTNEGAQLFLEYGLDEFVMHWDGPRGDHSYALGRMWFDVMSYSISTGARIDYRQRAVGEDGAAWVEEAGITSVRYIDGVYRKEEALPGETWPWVDGTDLVWRGRSGDDIVLRSRSESIAFSGPGSWDAAPVLRDGEVVWLSDGALVVRSTSGAIRPLHGPTCQPPYAHEGRVIAACGSEEPFGFGRELLLYDGSAVRAIVTSEGAIGSVRMRGDLVAWIEYALPLDCASPSRESGRVMLLALDDPEPAPIEVARVSAPCWCCDAIWPTAIVELSDHVIAWNYALPAEPFEPGGHVGYALIEREDCEP
jgi:hypothetical protein